MSRLVDQLRRVSEDVVHLRNDMRESLSHYQRQLDAAKLDNKGETNSILKFFHEEILNNRRTITHLGEKVASLTIDVTNLGRDNRALRKKVLQLQQQIVAKNNATNEPPAVATPPKLTINEQQPDLMAAQNEKLYPVDQTTENVKSTEDSSIIAVVNDVKNKRVNTIDAAINETSENVHGNFIIEMNCVPNEAIESREIQTFNSNSGKSVCRIRENATKNLDVNRDKDSFLTNEPLNEAKPVESTDVDYAENRVVKCGSTSSGSAKCVPDKERLPMGPNASYSESSGEYSVSNGNGTMEISTGKISANTGHKNVNGTSTSKDKSADEEEPINDERKPNNGSHGAKVGNSVSNDGSVKKHRQKKNKKRKKSKNVTCEFNISVA